MTPQTIVYHITTKKDSIIFIYCHLYKKEAIPMKCKKLFEAIDRLNDEYIKFWIDVCNIESPTEHKDGVDKCGEMFIEKAKNYGFAVDIHKESISGNCVCITMNPHSDAAPVIFSGHLDTVHPIGLFGTPPVHCDKENIYGPGVCDCKGGAVASLLAMAALQECGFTSRPVKLLLQSDEENSSRASGKATVKYMCRQSQGAIAFLNAEPHRPGSVAIARKGISKYLFEITGKAAHASMCYNGASAIAEAAHKILELEKLKDADGITCSCGIINGGTAENTVPEKCTFTADVRFSTVEEMERADRLIEEITEEVYVPGTKCITRLLSRRVAMERCDKNLKLLDKLNAIYKENGLPELYGRDVASGSDAADLSAFGIPTLDSLGAEGLGIHSINEYAQLSSLAEAAKRLASVAYCI